MPIIQRSKSLVLESGMYVCDCIHIGVLTNILAVDNLKKLPVITTIIVLMIIASFLLNASYGQMLC